MKPKRLSSIVILSQRYQLIENDPADWTDGGMGRSNQVQGRITLRTGMPEDIWLATLSHEVIHLMADMSNLEAFTKDEVAVSTVANGLLDFLRQNPQIARRLGRTKRGRRDR